MKKIYLMFFFTITSFHIQAQLNCDFDPTIASENWTDHYSHSAGAEIMKFWTETPSTTSLWPAISGFKSAYMDRENIGQGNTAEYWLISRQTLINNNDVLTFRGSQTIAENQGTIFEVRITNGLRTNYSAYETLASYTETAFAVSDDDTEKTISLDGYGGQMVHIAFVRRHTQFSPATGGDRWIIDRVKVENNALKTSTYAKHNCIVYPNPTRDSWHFNAGEATIETITIVDLLGKTILTATPKSASAVIDASPLNSGVYVAKLNTGSKTENLRLVKD